MKLLNLKWILAVSALVLFGAAHASAAPTSACPATINASLTGCDVLFTINPDNSVTITTPSLVPYDSSDDQLVGVLNNSSTALGSLSITGALGSDLFGFEGDGICTSYLAVSTPTCGGGISDATGYAPAGDSFSNLIGTDSGKVNFGTPIAGNGGTAYFSLESAPSAGSITGGTVGGGSVPEPGSLMLLGSGLLGLVGLARRKVRI